MDISEESSPITEGNVHEDSTDALGSVDESSPDAKGFNLRPTNSSDPSTHPDAVPIEGPKFDPNSLYYDMTGDKFLIILNQHTFQKSRYFKYKQPSTRHGTDQDVISLKKIFKRMDFHVTEFRNYEYEEIMKVFKEFATRDHSGTACVCVTVLTHGDKGGEVHAADRPYLLADIISILEVQPSFVNKPKLFFVQACRGDNVDAGNTVQLDSESDSTLTVPTHADFLVLYSTVEDYLSYRDANGSWLIQTLCGVLEKHADNLDLLHMITLLNREIAYEKLTYVPSNKALNNKKQMPETRFTLTKLLKFQ